jgi:outer membrane protein assembly factor BamB
MHSPDPGQLQWQPVEDAPERGRSATLDLAEGREGRVVFASGPEDGTVELRRLDAAGRTQWCQSYGPTPADSAALLLHDGMLYAALYSDAATGGQVVALDVDSGAQRWTAHLQAMGPLHHSKYRNQIQLRLLDGRLAVFGDEAAGRYIEVLDPSSGRRLGYRKGEA